METTSPRDAYTVMANRMMDALFDAQANGENVIAVKELAAKSSLNSAAIGALNRAARDRGCFVTVRPPNELQEKYEYGNGTVAAGSMVVEIFRIGAVSRA